jgi:hypothetical protein
MSRRLIFQIRFLLVQIEALTLYGESFVLTALGFRKVFIIQKETSITRGLSRIFQT